MELLEGSDSQLSAERHLQFKLTPEFGDVAARHGFEDAVRYAVRQFAADVGVFVHNRGSCSVVTFTDYSYDLLGEPQTRLRHLAAKLFSDYSAASKTTESGSAVVKKIQHAMTSTHDGEQIVHAIEINGQRFEGKPKTIATRYVDAADDAPVSGEIVGFSRGQSPSIQIRTEAGRHIWASVRTGNIPVKAFQDVLDKLFPSVQLKARLSRDNSNGHEIQATELIRGLPEDCKSQFDFNF